MTEWERRQIEQQIKDLMEKAVARPSGEDQLGMIGFAATLLAAKMQSLLLQDAQENRKEETQE